MKVRSAARVVVALLAMLAVPAAALGARAAPIGGYTVVCCCGPHAALEECGCPDCPAAPQPALDDDLDAAALGQPAMAPCHGRRDATTGPSGIEWSVPPAPFAMVVPARADDAARTPRPLQARPADRPPTPPPR